MMSPVFHWRRQRGGILFLFFTLPLFLACQRNLKAPQQNHPNVILILADDMGYGDLGCYGQKTLTTPRIDELASHGMRFTRHYAGATVCAPSRAALLTGKHPGHISVRGNAPPGQLLLDSEVTLAEIFKRNGYATAAIGKWGVGHPPSLDDPKKNGFDHFFGYVNMWHAHNFYPEFLYRNGEKVPLPGNITNRNLPYDKDMPEGTGVAQTKTSHTFYELQNEALTFIEKNKNNPFFLYYALNMPHANNEAGYFLNDGMEVPDYGAFEGQKWPNPEKGFARMMEMVDQTVGNILSKLNEAGVAQNTIVVFASDNGPHEEGNHQAEFFNSNAGLRGTKRDLYEGGIRVPMIVHWPGKVSAGNVSEHVSAFWDWLPTLCELACIPSPSGLTDGVSFAPTLLGKPRLQKPHDFLYWEFYELGGRQALLQENWKYIKLNVKSADPNQVVRELYDLSKDPGETDNLIGEHSRVVQKLDSLMKTAHVPHPLVSLFAPQGKTETKF